MPELPAIYPYSSIRSAMSIINETGRGVALVVDSDRHLVGIVTDGDVRRAILDGLELDGPVSWLNGGKVRAFPLVAPAGTDPATLLALMRDRGVRHIPLLDPAGRVVDLATLDDLAGAHPPMQAVIMVGGYGTRLRPLTDDTPKPMLPVGGRPLLELTVRRLQNAGIRQVWMVVHYRPEQIVEHFGNGENHGVDVRYVLENEPLGTAGALGVVESEGPVLVLNGDVLSDIDYRAFLAYHQEQQADMTVAVRRLAWNVPYGVVNVEGSRVTALIEKPTAGLWINSGVYLLESYLQRSIPVQRANMTDVVAALLAMGRPVAAFPLTTGDYWLDVGSPASYQQAQEDAKAGRFGK